jgi:hypothetical protein
MKCLCRGVLFSVFIQFFGQSFDKPSSIRDWKIIGFTIQEPTIIHEKKGWFEYNKFLIFRTKAKESLLPAACSPPLRDHMLGKTFPASSQFLVRCP